MIAHFEVRNYKALQDVSVKLTPFHAVVGQNDAGKTSLLEAIHACCQASQGLPPAEWFPKPWVGKQILSHGDAAKKIEFKANGTTIAKKAFANTVRLFRDDPQNVWIAADGNDRARLVVGDDGSTVKRAPDSAAVRLTPIRSLFARLNPRRIAMPSLFSHQKLYELESDGLGTARVLDDLNGNTSRFQDINDEFARLFPQFERISLRRQEAVVRAYDEHGNESLNRGPVGKGIWFDLKDGGSIQASQASDGVLLVLWFLTVMHLPERPDVILIEEPETGLYPQRIEGVMQLFRELTEGKHGPPVQIILATHSILVADALKPEEITLMGRDANHSVRTRSLKKSKTFRKFAAEGFSLGEIWFNLTESDLFDDGTDSNRNPGGGNNGAGEQEAAASRKRKPQPRS